MPLHIPIVTAAQVASSVWSYATREVTNIISISNSALSQIWNFPTRQITSISNAALSEIWNYSTREITATGGTEASGTYSLPSGITEQDAIVVTPTELNEYLSLLLDMNNLTQSTTIRIYIQVDDLNYRLVSSAVFPTDFPTNAKIVPITLYAMSVNWKITLQSAVAEGAPKDIPYRYTRRKLA